MHRTTAGKGAMLLGLLCSLVCSAMVADAAPVASVAAAVGASQLTTGTEPVVQLPRARRGSEEFTQHAKKHCYSQRLAPQTRYSSLTAAKAACAANSNCFGVYDNGCRQSSIYLCDAQKITSSAKLTASSSSCVFEKVATSTTAHASLDQCLASCEGTANHGKSYSCNQQLSCDMACRMRHEQAQTEGQCNEACDRTGSSGCSLTVGAAHFSMCSTCHHVGAPADIPTQCRRGCAFGTATTVYSYPGTITRSQASGAVSEPSRSNLKLTKDFTVSIWANPSQRVGDWARVLGKGNSHNRNFGLWIHPDGRVLSQVYGPTGTNIWNVKGANAPLNTWTHVAATFSAGKQHTLYINGAPVGSLRTTGTPRTDNEPLTLGKAAFHTGFAGSLAKARVSAFAMSAAQIKAEFAFGKPKDVPRTQLTTKPATTTTVTCTAGSASTTAMLASLQPAAVNFQTCHDRVHGIGGHLGDLHGGVSGVRKVATSMSRVMKGVNSVLEKVNKAGIADMLGKIPKVGIFIKMGLKIAGKVSGPLAKLLELVAKSVKKLETAVKVVEKVFVATGKVTGPIATVLTHGHAALDAAHGCAAASGYTCDPATAAGRMESANSKAYPRAKPVLAAIGTAGAACSTALNPVDAALRALAAAAKELAKLLDPVLRVLQKVEDFVNHMDKLIREFADEVLESPLVQCALEIFEPVTDTLNLLTCPVDEVVAATFHFVVDALVQEVTTLVNKATTKIITEGIDAVVPDNFDLTIPDFKQYLPSEFWLATCAVAASKFPAHASTIQQVNAIQLPYTVTGKTLEQQILAKVLPHTQLSAPAGGKYESACAAAYTEMGADFKTCKSLTTYASPSRVADCPSGYTNMGATCHRLVSTYSARSSVASCPSGYTNMGATCHRVVSTYSAGSSVASCPSGYTNMGATCHKPVKCSGGWPWTWKCTGGGSVGMGSMTCPSNRFRKGARCYVRCKAGYTNNGETCGRAAHDLSMGSMTCPSNRFKKGARCYVRCKAGYTNNGETCGRAAHDLGMGSMTCRSTEFRTGARCYTKCKPGYTSAGEFCIGQKS